MGTDGFAGDDNLQRGPSGVSNQVAINTYKPVGCSMYWAVFEHYSASSGEPLSLEGRPPGECGGDAERGLALGAIPLRGRRLGRGRRGAGPLRGPELWPCRAPPAGQAAPLQAGRSGACAVAVAKICTPQHAGSCSLWPVVHVGSRGMPKKSQKMQFSVRARPPSQQWDGA